MTDNFFADAVKGAALGAALGPVGAGVGAAVAVVSDVADATGVTRWLFGPTGAATQAAVTQAVTTITGTSDSTAQGQVFESSPAAVQQLRLALAGIAAQRQAEADAAQLAVLQAGFADTIGARSQTLGLATLKSPLSYSAAVVSLVVLVTFGVVMCAALTRALPPGSETILNMLLGTLAAMATSVVSYWVGSSSGSARKTELLSDRNPATPRS